MGYREYLKDCKGAAHPGIVSENGASSSFRGKNRIQDLGEYRKWKTGKGSLYGR